MTKFIMLFQTSHELHRVCVDLAHTHIHIYVYMRSIYVYGLEIICLTIALQTWH